MLFFSAPFKPALLFRAGLLSIFFCWALHLPALAQLGGPDLQIMETLRDDYGWDVALGWGSGNPCPVAAPDWPGVICNNGRVSEIQVSCGANKLTTDFPAELNQLTELITLQIRGCWTDPNNPATAKDLTNLSKLNILRLDANPGLTGTLQDLLGNSMTSFPNFGVLEISNSGIGGIIPPDMPGNVVRFINQTRVGGTLPNNVPNVFRYIGNQLEGVLPPNWVSATPSGERKIDYNKFDVVNTPSGDVDNAQPGWRNTQTVPPTNVQVTPGAANEATLNWTPIGYTWDGGYYEVLASPTPGGPYTSYGTTESTGGKTATGLNVTGLPGGTNYFVVRTFTPAHTADSLEVYQAYNDPSSLPFQPQLSPAPRPSFQDTLNYHRAFRDNPHDLTSVNSAEVSAFICPGNILYVNDDADGNDNGSSWADAFNDLQEALALTASCPDVTEIWVAEGTYKPTSGTDRNISFSMQNGVAIYGGFPNTGNPTFADRDWAAYETILSGDIGTPGDNSDNSIHLFNNSNLDGTAVLDGFTLSGGRANGFSIPTQEGGAMVNQQSSPTINNCTFINNFATRNGAAVMNVTDCSPVFTNCLFIGNTNGGNGDGVIFDFNGGGSLLINCTISGNITRSAVLRNFANVNTQVQNCILWGNSNNNLFGDFTISHSIVQGGFSACSNCPGGNGNVDPLFVDAANGNLRLQECSPAIDAADNAANPSLLDLDGNPRVFNAAGTATIDVGAYEYPASFDFTLSCTIIYVKANASGNNDGSSWANAFNDLQDAFALASADPIYTEIWVAEGTYKPTSGTDRNASFSMRNNLAIYGGFSGTPGQEGDFSVRDWAAHETILSGDIGTPGDNSDNSIHLFNNSNLDGTAVLDGFTLSGGRANGPSIPTQEGGAMVNQQSSPTINNCTFINNFATRNGAAVMNVTDCSPVFTNCLFIGNTNGGNGDGVVFDFNGGGSLLINCTISGNSTRNAVFGNFANVNTQLQNCILWGNSDNRLSGDFTVSHSIVQGGFSACSNCPGGNGNVDPLFVDAANGNLRLQEGSPAIDAGDNTAIPVGVTTDITGADRIQNTTVDIGAYEFEVLPFDCPDIMAYIGDSCDDGNPSTVNDAIDENCSCTGEICPPGGEVWTARMAAEENQWHSVTYGNGLFVAVSDDGTNRVMTSPDGITWTPRSAAEQNGWRSVTYGNGLFVAVAESGTNRVMTSPDGITWTARMAAEQNLWLSVTYGNGLFVAVAFDGTNRVMTSPDGITWTARMAAEQNSWVSATYGNGLFVAVAASGTNRIMTSPDGITWTARTAAEDNSWWSVAYGNGLFVAVSWDGTNRVMTSPDGINWTARMAAEQNSWFSATYGNGLFVAVANSGTNRVMTSPDGINWTARTAAEDNSWWSVAYGNGQFVAVSLDGTNRVMTSPGGVVPSISITATPGSSINIGEEVTFTSISVNGGDTPTFQWKINGNPVGDNSPAFTSTTLEDSDVVTVEMTSSDLCANPAMATSNEIVMEVTNPCPPGGVTWTARSASANNGWNSVAYGNGLFVAVASSGANSVMTSPDGINWTARSAAANTVWLSVTYGNGLFVAVGSGAINVMISPDGINWTAQSGPELNGWQSVTYGNGLFVAVATAGANRVMTSPDGINWTARAAANNNSWFSVTYGNGLFVAVAVNGANRVMTSPDGINWTARAAAGNNQWFSVTYGNGLFVAVAVNGANRVMTSPDGINWTARAAIENNLWFSVTYGNVLFVAVAGDGANRVMTSPDGINWTARAAAENNQWLSVTYGNGLFVAVTNGGTNRVMTSPRGAAPDAPTGTLAITNNVCTNCMLSDGSIALGTVSGSDGTLEYSTDNGDTWSSTLPTYNQTGPAQTILASVLAANGCRSNSTQVGITAPDECVPDAPTGTLSITNSTCTDCSLSGGSIAIGTVSSTGGTLEYSTDNGASWSSTLPEYNQDGPAQTILASVLAANGCRSNSTQVGITAPGECITPAAPTGDLAITNSTCNDCSLSGGSIAIGTVSGTGGTLEYSTDNGASWSSTLPEYDQDGPAQAIIASVLSANGCRSNSTQVGITAPGECITPAAPTGDLAITNSTCNDCSLSGGSIAIGTVSGTGGTLEYSTDNGASWSSTLPEYNQDGPAQTILASVLAANGCRSNSTQVGITAPGECITPAAPTGDLAITNSTCNDCSLSGGSIAIGTVSGTGGTLEYSTDNGASWSSTLPEYNQDGPAQTILASVLAANGCRSNSTQVGITAPGECITPAAPTGDLAITNSTCNDCSLSGGSIAIGTVSGTGGTLEYSTDNGASWSSTLPEYNQDGPAQTILASVLAANGCRSNSTQVGITAPGECITPAAPTGDLAITNSTCNDCSLSGGSIAIGTVSGTGGTLEYSTDNGASWSSTLPEYNQDGPAQTILASVLAANGCRSNSTQVGITAPGECITPAAPTGDLAITNSTCTDCSLSGGSIAIGTVSSTGGTLEYSTDNGASWSSTLPEYNQDGPAQTILASVLAANGCRSNSTQVGVTAPGECITPAAPTGDLAITNSTCNDCSLSGGSIAIGTVSGTGGTLEYSTDNGASWSSTLPEYDQDGPAQTIIASVLSANGCRSNSIQVGETMPGTCATVVASCQNQTVSLEINGTGSLPASALNNASSGCSTLSFEVDNASILNFNCTNLGASTVTLTASDVIGNTSTCSATITVEDNVPPTAICLNTTVNLEPNGTYALKPTDVYNAGASSDNCGITAVSFPPVSFTCDQAGAAFAITVTVEDFSGNTDQCIAMVSVEAGTALPAGWAASDIGSQGAGSSYDYDPCASNNPNRGDFTVSTGAYNLIPNNSDNLAFIGRELCNNGGIQARIEDVSGGYAGLMIRESSAPGAKMVAVYSNLTSLLRREIRTTDNGPRASNTSFAPFPYWLRLVRQNDYIRAFYRTSDNGSWTLFHQAYLPMQPCVEMGLAVFTTDPNGQAQATFSQVQWQSNVGGNSLALFNDGAAAAQPEEREASVFPNPARDAFTLAFSKAPESGGIAILRNQMGQALEQRQLLPGEAATDWDISRLPGGLYLLEVRQGGWPPQVLRVVKAN